MLCKPRAWQAIVVTGLLLCLVSCAQTGRTRNKVVQADGRKYVACGGAIWSRDDGNMRDPAAMSYDVFFKAPDGKIQHLTMVHSLAVTDLADNAPECAHGGADFRKPQN